MCKNVPFALLCVQSAVHVRLLTQMCKQQIYHVSNKSISWGCGVVVPSFVPGSEGLCRSSGWELLVCGSRLLKMAACVY